MWKNTIKKKDEFEEGETGDTMERDGGFVDDNNPIHRTVEEIIKKHGYGKSAEKVIERLKLRMKWLMKNAEYGGRD